MFSMNNEGAADNAPVSPEVEAALTANSTPSETIERSILRDCSAALDEARKRVAECEAEIERLELVIAEGDKAAAVLQAQIAGDGAAGIAALVKGEAKPDAAMTSIIAIELAVRAAQARLPAARAELEQANAQAMRAEVQRNLAARNAMVREADRVAARYAKLLSELAETYDSLVGISGALPPLETLGQEIHNLVTGFTIPRFNLPSNSTSAGYAPTFVHIPDEWRVNATRARWAAARDRLIDDPDADLNELLKPPKLRPFGDWGDDSNARAARSPPPRRSDGLGQSPSGHLSVRRR